MAAAVAEGFRPLDEGSLLEYIRATPAILEVLGGRVGDGELTIKEVGGGNLNFLYIVVGPAGSVVIKQLYKKWILKTIEDTWNLFHKKFLSHWDEHKDGSGEAYLSSIYNNPELFQRAQQIYLKDLFHDSLGFGAAKMIRRIVGIAHVEDFESIRDAARRAYCEHRALEFAKMLVKQRRQFHTINEITVALQSV